LNIISELNEDGLYTITFENGDNPIPEPTFFVLANTAGLTPDKLNNLLFAKFGFTLHYGIAFRYDQFINVESKQLADDVCELLESAVLAKQLSGTTKYNFDKTNRYSMYASFGVIPMMKDHVNLIGPITTA
jgi:hypothetical protein